VKDLAVMQKRVNSIKTIQSDRK